MHICLYNPYIDIVKIIILYKYNSLFFIKLYIFIPTHFNAKNLKFPINQGLRAVQKSLLNKIHNTVYKSRKYMRNFSVKKQNVYCDFFN